MIKHAQRFLVKTDTRMTKNPSDVLQMGAVALARAIRAGELNPVDVVEAHIQRIEAVNPYINAVVTPMFASAREQAQQASQRLKTANVADLPPLFGVPVTIKDSWPIAGERLVGGSWHLRDNIATEDAPVVQRMKAAGAIILGKTNCPDMCWLAETDNPVFGRTNNPWDLERSAGGSSGGEGAIIAAGGSPLGIGSDIAGSVRIPAATNGLVSLKPTGGRVPSAGHLPKPADEIITWNTAGPMARRVEDLALALDILSDTPTRDYAEISLQGRRLIVYINNGIYPVRGPVKETVGIAADALERTGMDVIRDQSVPMIQAALAFAARFSRYNIPGIKRDLGMGNGKPISAWGELFKSLRGKSHITRSVLTLTAMTDIGGKLFAPFGYAKEERLQALKEQFIEAMTPGGILLCPMLVTPPPKHGWTNRMLWTLPYSFMFNALELPVSVVPIRLSDDGLPLCVQIVGTPGEDETVLRVAAELEHIYGGWQIADPIGKALL